VIVQESARDWTEGRAVLDRFAGGVLRSGLILTLAAGLCAGCAPMPIASPSTPTSALADPENTALGHEVAQLGQEHPALSAFHVLPTGTQALAARAGLIDAAQRTLDLQYYMVHEGLATDYLLQKLIAAADRGVRVRFLIDDSSVWGRDVGTAALSSHPNIEVRVFNSIGVGRHSSLGRAMALALGVSRLHRRMHNKMLVADNTAAIIGGRNLADEYFGAAPDMNFADLDLLIAGPVVREVSASFDEYWNSRWAVPIESLTAALKVDVKQERAKLDKKLEEHRQRDPEYLRELDRAGEITAKLEPELSWVWASGHAVYDSPDKMSDQAEITAATHIGPRLLELLDPVQSELVIISAYFIPGDDGAARLEALAERGVRVTVVTNGLAATDVTAVYAAYAPYRERLVRGGVQLYEISPDPKIRAEAKKHGMVMGSSSASLHTKAIVFDGKRAFVGSMNLDPRSQLWNTEIGVLVESPEFAQQILKLLQISTRSDNSYHVVPDTTKGGKGKLNWIGMKDGAEYRYTSEPAGWWRSFEATMMNWVLPEELL
jgi:putative cardiolipin synthase